MNLIVLAACFLLVLCPPRHRVRAHSHSHHQPVETAVAVDPCGKIKSDWDEFRFAWGYGPHVYRDEFVKKYPADQQRQVLQCIGE